MPKIHEFSKFRIVLFRENAATIAEINAARIFFNSLYRPQVNQRLFKEDLIKFNLFIDSIRKGDQDFGYNQLWFLPVSANSKNPLLSLGESLLKIAEYNFYHERRILEENEKIIFYEGILRKLADRVYMLGLLHQRFF